MRKFIDMINEWYGHMDDEEEFEREWPTETLEVGTILYHGTSEDADFSAGEIERSAWFSRSKSVSEYFAKRAGGTPVIYTYKVDQPITLPVFHYSNDFEEFCERFYIDAGSGEDMIDSMRSAGKPGWIIPNNYPDGDDILIMNTQDLVPV